MLRDSDSGESEDEDRSPHDEGKAAVGTENYTRRSKGVRSSKKSKSARSASSHNKRNSLQAKKISRNLSVAEIRAIKQKKLANGGVKLAFQATRPIKRSGVSSQNNGHDHGDARREDEIRKVKKVKNKKKVRRKKRLKRANVIAAVDERSTVVQNNNRFDVYNSDDARSQSASNSGGGQSGLVAKAKSTTDLSSVYANHPGITFIP